MAISDMGHLKFRFLTAPSESLFLFYRWKNGRSPSLHLTRPTDRAAWPNSLVGMWLYAAELLLVMLKLGPQAE